MGGMRKIAAILVADIVGYSRLAGTDEDRTLARLRPLRSDLIDPTIALHHGRVVKRTVDGSLIEFRSAVDAVRPLTDTRRRRDRLQYGVRLGMGARRVAGSLFAPPLGIGNDPGLSA
jgi:class 3 adenylate cyclase